jgi:hypothetical protein
MPLESGGIKAETVVREGAAAENIVQYAQENGIDLTSRWREIRAEDYWPSQLMPAPGLAAIMRESSK